MSFYRQPLSLNDIWRRGNRPAILLLLLLAFWLRTYQLDDQALRGDEAATVLYSALPVTELWELSRVTDPHPPLYYLMLHPWQWLAGESAWAMRFAGVMASTLAVAVFYTLAQQTLRRPAYTLPAAALLAINPLQIWLAQDIRSYPFMTLLGLLSSWLLWLALHHSSHQSPITNHQSPITNYQLYTTYYELRTTPHVLRFILHPLCPPHRRLLLHPLLHRFSHRLSGAVCAAEYPQILGKPVGLAGLTTGHWHLDHSRRKPGL